MLGSARKCVAIKPSIRSGQEALDYVHGTPAVDDTAAYLAGCDEVFRAVRLSDGQPLFRLPIGAYTGASVALQQSQGQGRRRQGRRPGHLLRITPNANS
jgi:hypothetical protein